MDDFNRTFAPLAGAPDLRIAIVGIGNELNGDDAAGVLIARALIGHLRQKRGAPPPQPGAMETDQNVLVIDSGPSPESFTGPLRRFAPNLVVLVDAAELSEAPGVVRVFDWPEVQGMSASTHTMPPSMLARFLVNELGCRVMLVGIQPAGLTFDDPLSPEVQRAVDALIAGFLSFLDRSILA